MNINFSQNRFYRPQQNCRQANINKNNMSFGNSTESAIGKLLNEGERQSYTNLVKKIAEKFFPKIPGENVIVSFAKTENGKLKTHQLIISGVDTINPQGRISVTDNANMHEHAITNNGEYWAKGEILDALAKDGSNKHYHNTYRKDLAEKVKIFKALLNSSPNELRITTYKY